MIAQYFRIPQAGEEGRWYSCGEILSILKDHYSISTMARFSPEKIGNTLGGRPFNLKSEHKTKGNCYLLMEMKPVPLLPIHETTNRLYEK